MNYYTHSYILAFCFFCLAGVLFAQTSSLDLQIGNENPLNGFNTSLDFNPVAVDIDNDGDLDIFSGSYFGLFHFFRNDGTSTVPSFSDQSITSSNPLNGITVGASRSRMEFVDIDDDGDFDLFSGSNQGVVKFLKNNGTASSPVFSATITNSNYFNRDFGAHTNLEFVDIDNDNDYDAFVTTSDSNIYYYENTGSVTVPVFTERTGGLNPLNSVSTNTYLYGDFSDMDNDGDMDFYTGSFQGLVFYYLNTGTASSPIFVLQSGSNNLLSTISVGNNGRLDIGLMDINGDNIIDAFVGQRVGGAVSFYKGKSNSLGTNSYSAKEQHYKFYPNPVNNVLHIEGNLLEGAINIYNVLGKKVISTNITKNLDVSTLNKGVYIVEITAKNTMVIKKFIKN